MTDKSKRTLALEACQRLFKEALPKFNWGASALDANAISLLNQVPRQVDEALDVDDLDDQMLWVLSDLLRRLLDDPGRHYTKHNLATPLRVVARAKGKSTFGFDWMDALD